MELDTLTQALRLHARGLAVFPVDEESKTPLAKWGGLKAEMPTEDKVREWFTGKECAVGIACGPVSGIFLLDFDFKHPEAKQFYESHTFPRTWKETTASGGIHLYFKWTDALNFKQTNTTSKIHRGVDTKGHGGYSKISPSPGYQWIVPPHIAPLAMPPQWLIDALRTKEKEINGTFVPKPENWILAELNSINAEDPTNGRTPTFTRVIGSLKSRRLSEAEIKAFLTPWVTQHSYEQRIDGLIADQFKRYPLPAEVQHATEDESIADLLKSEEKVEWVIQDMIPKQGIGFFAGLPEACKTWILLDLALELARGGLWLNKFPVKPCKVLYIDQERIKPEMVRRIRALLSAKEITGESIAHNFTSRCATKTKIHLNNPETLKVLETTLEAKRPDFVIVDSYKTFHSSNELSTQDSQKIMQKLQELRDKYKCGFLFVHHETKGVIERRKEGGKVSYTDASGTIDLPQTADTFFNVVSRGESESMMYHTKLNGGTKRAPLLVKVIDKTADRSRITVEAF